MSVSVFFFSVNNGTVEKNSEVGSHDLALPLSGYVTFGRVFSLSVPKSACMYNGHVEVDYLCDALDP